MNAKTKRIGRQIYIHCIAVLNCCTYWEPQAVASCHSLAVGSVRAALPLQPQAQLLHQVRQEFTVKHGHMTSSVTATCHLLGAVVVDWDSAVHAFVVCTQPCMGVYSTQKSLADCCLIGGRIQSLMNEACSMIITCMFREGCRSCGRCRHSSVSRPQAGQLGCQRA